MKIPVFLSLLLCLLLLGCGDVANTSPTSPRSNEPGNNDSTKSKPEPTEAYIHVLDDFFKAFEAMDGEALKKTLTQTSLRAKGGAWAKELTELRETVERLEVTRRDTAYDEEVDSWWCTYDFTLHMKNGKEDGEPNKELWVVRNSDGKWQIDLR